MTGSTGQQHLSRTCYTTVSMALIRPNALTAFLSMMPFVQVSLEVEIWDDALLYDTAKS